MQHWLFNLESDLILDLLKSLFLLAILFSLRPVLVRLVVKMRDLNPEAKRRWVVSVRNALLLAFVIGLIFIWAGELRTLAVSLVAVAVAFVLATKELILCVSGSILRMGANAYAPGDRIEIGAVRGKVLDQTMLVTRLLEIGPSQSSQQYTGRTVVFPNSLLLTTPLVNETNMQGYVLHVLKIPLRIEDDWQTAERLLLEAAVSECGPFVEEARQVMKQLEGNEWFDAPSVEPRVSLQYLEPGKIQLLLRIPVPSERIARVEQAILRRFLSFYPITEKT